MPDPKVVVTKNKLDNLANSIAVKSGVPVKMTVDQMKLAVDSIEIPEAEYYIWQDSEGYIHASTTMPAVTSVGSILKLPGWLMRVGVMERVVDVSETKLHLTDTIVQEVTELDESD